MDRSQVCGAGEVTSDQGGAGGSREPGGAVRPIVPSGAEGGRMVGVRVTPTITP